MENKKRLIDANTKMIDKYFNKRLIDARALKDAMYSIATVTNNESIFIDVIIDEIDNAPTVDAVEVVHGRWLDRTKVLHAYVEYRIDCSVCGIIFWHAGVENFNYCPNCGAKMDGDGNG